MVDCPIPLTIRIVPAEPIVIVLYGGYLIISVVRYLPVHSLAHVEKHRQHIEESVFKPLTRGLAKLFFMLQSLLVECHHHKYRR